MNRRAVKALTLSAAGLIALLVSEGYTDRAVIPVPGDVPTVGFGSTRNVRLGDTTNPVSALARAGQEINEEYEAALRRCVHVPLYQHEYDAWVSFVYNVGAGAFCRSTAAKLLNQGRYAEACDQMRRWVFVNGQRVQGLVNRRERERRACLGE